MAERLTFDADGGNHDSCQVDRGSSRKRDVVRALLKSGSCETHENSYAEALVVRFRSICNVRLIVTGNFAHRSNQISRSEPDPATLGGHPAPGPRSISTL